MRNLKEFRRPGSIDEAVAMLRAGPGKGAVLAGGTRLVLGKDPTIEYVVDISRLGLNAIAARDGGLAIGATTTLQQIVESEAVQGFAGGLLARAGSQQATEIVRNAATIGGEIAARFGFSDLLVALLALDARAVVRGPAGDQTVALADFLAGPLLAGEIIAEVVLPPAAARGRSAYQRLSRTKADQPIASAAALVTFQNGVCARARLAVGGAWALPRLVSEVDAVLAGRPLSAELAAEVERLVQRQADPPSDVRASAEYRRQVAGVLARRALLAAGGMA